MKEKKQQNRHTSATPSMSSKNRQQIVEESITETNKEKGRYVVWSKDQFVKMAIDLAISKTAGLLEKVHKKEIEDLKMEWLNKLLDAEIKTKKGTAKAIFDDVEKFHCAFCGVIDGKCVDGETDCQEWKELKKKWVGKEQT